MKRLTIIAFTAVALAAVTGAATASVQGKTTLRSTLDRKKVLPHRIHWIARPNIPSSKVAAVYFLIDDRRLWVEHHPPYYYGDDGNYLVTSFLKPGIHTFTVKVVTRGSGRATDTVRARVLPSPAPPAALAGNWTGLRPAGGVPAGNWRLAITSEGWEIIDTKGGGNRIDVDYLSAGVLEMRTGMATGHPKYDLNGWCNDAPGTPVRYHWSVDANGLHLSLVKGHACPGFTAFVTGPWTRAQ